MKHKEKVKKEAENNKGIGFVALGEISRCAKNEYFEPKLKDIFNMIQMEVNNIPPELAKNNNITFYVRPHGNSDVLTCIKDLCVKYGDQIEE